MGSAAHNAPAVLVSKSTPLSVILQASVLIYIILPPALRALPEKCASPVLKSRILHFVLQRGSTKGLAHSRTLAQKRLDMLRNVWYNRLRDTDVLYHLNRQAGFEYDRALLSHVRKGVVNPEAEGILSGRENVYGARFSKAR